MFTNSPGAEAYSWFDPTTDTGSTVLSRAGREVGRSDVPGIAGFSLPASTGRYDLTVAAAVQFPGWDLTSRVIDEWSFMSGEVRGTELKPLPLLDVEYDLPLDLDNAAPAGAELTGSIEVAPQVGVEPARISSVRVEVSNDDGTTWRRASVRPDGRMWTVRIPAGEPGSEFASLRTTATDAAGNRVTETLIRAYRVG